jgi:hypothetical protein
MSEDAGSRLYRLMSEEALIDLLGGMMPGVLFLATTTVIVVPAVHFIVGIMSPTFGLTLGDAISGALAASRDTPSAIWFALFIVLLLLAYIVGHLFYRHDPRRPDQRSFRHLAREAQYRPPLRLRWWSPRELWAFWKTPWVLCDKQKLRDELACSTLEECLFPYPGYGDYLRKRKLDHLLEFALWVHEGRERSKNYINIIKIQLRYEHPERCGSVLRNEAHVRLASSTWYVSQALFWLSVILVLLLALLQLWSFRAAAVAAGGPGIASRFLVAALPASIVGVAALYARMVIEKFLHYQRLREVFFVLQTAAVALKEPPLGPI